MSHEINDPSDDFHDLVALEFAIRAAGLLGAICAVAPDPSDPTDATTAKVAGHKARLEQLRDRLFPEAPNQ